MKEMSYSSQQNISKNTRQELTRQSSKNPKYVQPLLDSEQEWILYFSFKKSATPSVASGEEAKKSSH